MSSPQLSLSHLIATDSPHLIIPRERLKERMEETFGCEYELFIEFTDLISWCRGASIGWHSDDNMQYLKQRDFSAVCYLNSYVHILQDKDRSLDASEQLMGPVQIAKGGELLNRKFTNILHALQVVHFYHWKASELKISKVENDTLEEVETMSQPQLETINALKSVFLPDEGLVTTVFGYSCCDGDGKNSLDLTDILPLGKSILVSYSRSYYHPCLNGKRFRLYTKSNVIRS